MRKQRGRKSKKKRERAWLGYYCKIVGFDAYGAEDGPSLELQLELLEPVPKVSSVTLSVYCEEAEWKITEHWIPDQGTERRIIPSRHSLGNMASRNPDGCVQIATWWQPHGVLALMNILVSGRQLYLNLDVQEFYRNHAEARAIEWHTEGSWRAHVVGEDSNLY